MFHRFLERCMSGDLNTITRPRLPVIGRRTPKELEEAMTKVVNNTCAKCGAPIGALVRTCGETKGDPRTEGVCLKEG